MYLYFYMLVLMFETFWSLELLISYFLFNLFMFNFFMMMKNNYMMDYLSYFMVSMTMLLSLLIIMYLKKSKILLFMFMILMKIFMSMNLFEIFILFEFSLLPMFFYIIMNGNYFGRLKASMYMIMYTIFLSMPFIIYIINMKMEIYFNYFSINDMEMNLMMTWMFFMVICVKTPIFMLHVWLPKAHVESSIEGSMVLAGIMLKISIYLLIRTMNLMNKNDFFESIYWFCLWSCLLVSVICINMWDYKMMIAYSSIAHMMLIMISLSMMSKIFFITSILTSISHAFISSNMFFSLNILYKKMKSKSMIINKGIFFINKPIMYMIFLISSTNFSIPPFTSFFSELMNSLMIIFSDINSTIFLMMLMYLYSMYNMNFFFNISFGKMKFMLMIYPKEYFMMISQIYLSLILIIFIISLIC